MKIPGFRYFFVMICLFISTLLASNVFANTVNNDRETIVPLSSLKHEFLPVNSKINRYIITIDVSRREDAKTKYRILLKDRGYIVFIAREIKEGNIVGGLVTIEFPYKDSMVTLAVVLNDELRVLRAVVTEVDKLYLKDFEATIGLGVLKRYTMTSIRQLKYLASVMKKDGRLAELVSTEIAMMAAALAVEMLNPKDETG